MNLEDLVPHPENPRTITEEAMGGLMRSLDEFGDISGIVWNRRDGYLVAGHQRLAALRERFGSGLQMQDGAIVAPDGERFPVRVVDWDEERARAARIIANNPRIAGDWTDAAYGQIDAVVEAFPEFEDAFRLDELRDDFPPLWVEPTAVDETSIPEPPGEPVTQPGDLWVLGDHRLLCGDSTDQEAAAALMDGAKAGMVFTDPPWNVTIGGDNNPIHRQRDGLRNDNLPENQFEQFLRSAAAVMASVCTGDVYCVMGGQQFTLLDRAMRDAGFHWSSTVVWVKEAFVFGRSKYHRRYEPIWYGWHKNTKSSFCGARNKSDVWEFDRPRRSEEHPTMKPVALVQEAITNSSKPGDIVLDLFAGAGSTMLAAEALGRRCYAVEIEPRFCDVIVHRWEELTDGKAERITGGPYDAEE